MEDVPANDAAGIAAYVRIRSAVTPESPDSAEHVAWESASYPGQTWRLLARDPDRTPVGTASVSRIRMLAADYPRYWLGLWVLPEVRGRGIGSALFAAGSEIAASAGKTGFLAEVSERQAEGCRFLAARGFTEAGRSKAVELALAGMAPPAAAPPAGIRITTLAAERDLVPGVHRAAVEALPDVPTSDEPMHAGTLEEFVARDVERHDVPLDGFFVALDEALDEVVGYAIVAYRPGSHEVAYHDMTAVRPAYRGRGIASALKRASVAWAIEHGLQALETGNDVENAPMLAINARLGYTPLPDLLYLQGPLAPAH
jgi:GNAT superfamily N-acetyltransferase